MSPSASPVPSVRLMAYWPTPLDQARPIIMADLIAPPVTLRRPLPVSDRRGL